MPPATLARHLGGGMMPEDWYELLNSKVFFWLDRERLDRHRHACRASEQIVLTIDAARLLARYGSVSSVSPINSGNVMRAAVWRSTATFVPYDRWLTHGWIDEQQPGIKARPNGHRPVELAIDTAVVDIMAYVTTVTPLKVGESFNS
jgi:hypothetical protein